MNRPATLYVAVYACGAFVVGKSRGQASAMAYELGEQSRCCPKGPHRFEVHTYRPDPEGPRHPGSGQSKTAKRRRAAASKPA